MLVRFGFCTILAFALLVPAGARAASVGLGYHTLHLVDYMYTTKP